MIEEQCGYSFKGVRFRCFRFTQGDFKVRLVVETGTSPNIFELHRDYKRRPSWRSARLLALELLRGADEHQARRGKQ